MYYNAKYIPCKVLRRTTDPLYGEGIRRFQGCPTIAVTKGGRIYMGWYAGGPQEPHMDNYLILVYSDDDGKTWENLLIVPSDKENFIHALDIQLWISPDQKLYVFWVQNNTCPIPEKEAEYPSWMPVHLAVDGVFFDDAEHAMWAICCDDPDAPDPQFTEPRYLDIGFLRTKPLALDNGSWLLCNYSQNDCHNRYGYSISADSGKTFVHHFGCEKIQTTFDETMAYQRRDGSVRMLARTRVGELAETVSTDGGKTWEKAKLSGIDSPDTRFFISRTPSGRILLVNNDSRTQRANMSVYLSEDDGATWKYKRLIDGRENLSYPDADFYNGKIYLTYDRGRCRENEILFLSFREEDIMDENYRFCPTIASKPTGGEPDAES